MIRWVMVAALVQTAFLSLLAILLMRHHAPSVQQLTIREGLYTLFADGDCNFDCVMGIRAGHNFPTPIDEAIAILEQHPWVESVETHAVSRRTTWTWSGQQPPVIDASRAGMLIPSKLYEENISRVGIMQIPVRATLHDFVIAYGLPDSSRFGYDPDSQSLAQHYASYRHLRLQLNGDLAAVRCPVTPQQIAEAPTLLTYGILADPLFEYAAVDAVFPFYDAGWLRGVPFCR